MREFSAHDLDELHRVTEPIISAMPPLDAAGRAAMTTWVDAYREVLAHRAQREAAEGIDLPR
jgi:hypothetical protein